MWLIFKRVCRVAGSFKEAARARHRTIIAFAILLLAVPVASQALIETQKLTASDGFPGDGFGPTVGISGETAIVGAGRVESAYVFELQAGLWRETAKLHVPNVGFGFTVAIQGDYAAVSASAGGEAGFRSGAAYVFERAGGQWDNGTKLIASDGARLDRFGSTFAFSGNSLLVGASGNGGAVYVFEQGPSGWNEIDKLVPADNGSFDLFGDSIAVSGDTLAIGAPNDSDFGFSSGSAYVYRRSATGTWNEVAKLLASDGAENDFFGDTIAVSDETVLVGAQDKNMYEGAAYVFEKDAGGNWPEVAKLTASDKAPEKRFGESVAILDDTIVVGSTGPISTGALYLFQRSPEGWGPHENRKVTASDAEIGDGFGEYLGITDDWLIVGTLSGSMEVGSAYMFRRETPALTVVVDIKPGSSPNSVNPRSNGVIPAAILGSRDFAVTTVDAFSVTLGEASKAHDSAPMGHLEDVNDDGYTDMLLHFRTQEIGIQCDATELSLEGQLLDGTPIIGTDTIEIKGKCN